MSKKKDRITPEWSHRVEAADIGLTPIRTTISASPQERKDLARRIQVERIDRLEARLVMQRESNAVIHVTGELAADIVQPCAITLEPVEQTVNSTFEGWFADPESVVPIARARHEKQGRKAGAELPILEEEDDPEPIIDGQIDLGELATQHLSLAIDPYPHKEGAVFAEVEAQAGIVPEVRKNPFAALKNWKRDKNSGN